MMANKIIENTMIYDNPNALGSQYIFVGEYNNSAHSLSTECGIASNTFTVRKGTCRIQARVITPIPDDSFYLNIPGETTHTVNHASSWMIWNNIEPGSDWH